MERVNLAQCLRLIVACIAVVAMSSSAKAQNVGTITIWGAEGTWKACTDGGCGETEPVLGGVIVNFSSPNETFKVGAGFGAGATASAMAESICSQLTSYVLCTGVTENPAGYYNLSLTSAMTFLTTAEVTVDTKGGRGVSIIIYPPYFYISGPNWALVQPKYYVMDLLYAPPGNTSSAGFTNGTSQSTTTTIGSSFMSGVGQSYTASLGFGGDRVSLGTSSGSSTTTSSSSAFQETVTTAVGSTLKSTENAIDHTQDQFWLLLNPEIAVVQSSATGIEYSISTINNEYADIVNVSVAELQNPSLIPLSVLETQTDPTTGLPLPGLKNVCAASLPDNQCTTANACGCVAKDFAAIIPLDELVANPNVSPVAFDPNRFHYVETLTLEGPACSTCDPVTNTYTVTDSGLASETTGSSQSYSVGFNAGYTESFLGIISFSETDSTSLTWTNNYSFGSSNGTSHSETVTLGTNGVACYQPYDIYEDGEFHTFTYYPVVPSVPAC